MTESNQLLREYSQNGSEPAFRELVGRYVDLVYSTALRRADGDMQLVQDIVQTAFADLARKAQSLPRDVMLGGWLHHHTIFVASNFLRGERRRQNRERQALEMNALQENSDAVWKQLAPVLDEAIDCLSAPDRDAILLRFFEQHDLRAVGAALGISEDAAQKRVSRAVEQLREFFSKQGVGIGATGLVTILSANAVQSAPLGLVAAISSSAALSGAAIKSTTIGLAKTLAMTTIQKALVTATIIAAVGTGIYEARQASSLRTQNQLLKQEQAPLAEQIQQLQREREEAANRLAALADEIARVKSDSAELLRLRGEVVQLRDAASQANDPFIQTALAWKAKEAKLRKLFEDRPDQRIPEMQFLTDRLWLDIARDSDLDSDEGIRSALGRVRSAAQQTFASMMQQALIKYVKANNGNLPDNPSQLTPFFNAPVDDATLQRYEVLTNEELQAGWAKGAVFVEKSSAVVDKWMDGTVTIGPQWIGRVPLPAPVHLTFPKELIPAMEAYQAENNGQTPEDLSKLRPYITTPEQEAALGKLINALKQ